jgi:valyl-tRNA synthetase
MNGARLPADFDPAACEQRVNRWLVGKVAETARDLDKAMAGYRFDEAASTLYHFTWHLFCDWYIEFAKPLLQEEGAAAEEVRATMGWALNRILCLMHPLMPFITEELWEKLGFDGDGLLIATQVPDFPESLIDPEAAAEMDWAIRLISEVRTVRAEMNVPPAAKIDLKLKDAGATTAERLERQREVIQRLARLSSVEILEGDAPEGAVQFVVEEAVGLLPLAEVIDLSAEKARLEKEIAKADSEIGKLDKKLANEQFLAKAPAEVVEENKSRRTEEQETRDKLAAALERLEAV